MLSGVGVPGRIYYAMKANRFEQVLAAIRAEGDIGIDACSVTASMLSNRDLDFGAALQAVRGLATGKRISR